MDQSRSKVDFGLQYSNVIISQYFQTTAAPTFNFGAAPAPKSDTPSFQFGAAPPPSTDSGDTMDASSQSPKGFSFGQKPAASNGPTFSFGSNSNSKYYIET